MHCTKVSRSLEPLIRNEIKQLRIEKRHFGKHCEIISHLLSHYLIATVVHYSQVMD